MGDESTRWTIVIDKATDVDVRTMLAERGMKKGDLSKYVRDVIRRDLFAQSLAEFQKGFEHMDSDEIDALVDEALTSVRANPEAYDRDP